jgi:hypothetical protein
MTNRHCICAFLLGSVFLSSTAFAGEVNGSTTIPKDDFSNGVSICKFSGLNDYPDGSKSGPPGRTQNYGQDVSQFGLDPQDFNPGDPGGCNAHTDPFRDAANPNQ